MPNKRYNMKSLTSAGLDHHHAMASERDNGSIAHAQALAEVIMVHKLAQTEYEAVALAQAEIARTHRLADGVLINRMARLMLDEKARARSRTAPKAVHPGLKTVG
jgi:hypothetical protein